MAYPADESPSALLAELEKKYGPEIAAVAGRAIRGDLRIRRRKPPAKVVGVPAPGSGVKPATRGAVSSALPSVAMRDTW